MNIMQREISRTPPHGVHIRKSNDGKPILFAYGCALYENYMGDYFLYKVVNLETNKSVKLCRRVTAIAPHEIERVAQRMRDSKVAGAARLEADRPKDKRATLEKCTEILNEVFRKILPEYGYKVRYSQIKLAEKILKSISSREMILAEAEVGTGKTLAYLVAAILPKRGRLNDFWNSFFYPEMNYTDTTNMPIVIATSSIALQHALINDYIPELSRILTEQGVIKQPLTAVLRKGREHYLCDCNLALHYSSGIPIGIKKQLRELFKPTANIDLTAATGLTANTKRQICVPARCDEHCPMKNQCRYRRFAQEAMNPTIDIQVVNHNYLIADAMLRKNSKRPLIPNYQSLIVDEAHKLLSAARSMYGAELSSDTVPSILSFLETLKFHTMSAAVSMSDITKKLRSENRRLFYRLGECLPYDDEDETERFCVDIDSDASRHLRNIRDIADRLYEQLSTESVLERHENRKKYLLWEIDRLREHAAVFARHNEHICWLEEGSNDEVVLHSVPKDVDTRLHDHFWNRGIPTILTSGTLSAGGDFSHIKRTLGLEKLQHRITETSKPSPFDHKQNAMLYISESVPFPDNNNKAYIDSVTDEVEKLIRASHGHAAVLFTSYNTMGRVYAALSKRDLPFPLMRLERKSSDAIEKFKQSKNGVLFASGALWEGIDIPGDSLSMLIIVKMPFQVPDPIGEYEQTLYRSMVEYKNRVIVPEMLIKLKQGFGRLLRTEKDTGVVAILDCRANIASVYRRRVLDALPKCRITNSILEVCNFISKVKSAEYFA